MERTSKYTFEYIKKNGLILLDTISGSHAYGLDTPQSDIDRRGIFIVEQDDLYGLNYPDQINDDKNDIVYYEIGRFMQLALSNNPNILELLATPDDCVTFRHELLQEITPEPFLSKECKNSFAGYAIAQIKKARGLNKKIVQEMPKEKKTPFDFCFALSGSDATPLRGFLEERGIDQRFCGVVNVPHAKDVYALYHDLFAQILFGDTTEKSMKKLQKETIRECKEKGLPMGFGYKGIVMDDSNSIRFSSIPKGEDCITLFTYNKDGYTKFNSDYKSYWHWVANRNPARYNDNVAHGQGYDGKNLMHCHRLLNMVQEIAQGKGINVRRAERELLLSIRRGEMDYEKIVSSAEDMIKNIDLLFETSSLPDKPDRDKINKVLIDIRNNFYT